MREKRPARNNTPAFLWAFTTYFAEGLPYSLIRTISSFFFRASGVSLEATGLTSLFGLAWIFKFLWAPLLDTFATKRQWLLITEGLLFFLFCAITLTAGQTWAMPLVAFFFLFASFVAATHDTAIDGYYLEALDQAGQARFVGYRVMAYRIAMMFGSGVIVTLGSHSGWTAAFGLAACLLALLLLFHTLFLPRCETERRPLATLAGRILASPSLGLLIAGLLLAVALLFHDRARAAFLRLPLADATGILLLLSLLLAIPLRGRMIARIRQKPDSIFARAFLSFLDQQRIKIIILFIILVRAGEFLLSAMTGPFFIDAGLKEHYGWITGGIGLPCSIVGAMAGGWLIARKSLQKMIWPFLLAQNLTNVVYMLLAFYLLGEGQGGSGGMVPTVRGIDLLLTCGVVSFDSLAGGLGTAVLMTFLMGLCKDNFKAAHYAIGTGLMSVSGVYAGAFSGFLVKWWGYGWFFGASFCLSLPAMALLPFLPWPAGKEKQ